MTWRPLEDESDNPRPLRGSLDAIARKLGAPTSSALETLFARWPELVGDVLAAHAKPVSLRRKTLTVAVDDPAWAAELRFLAADIVARCREVAGPDALTRIDVKVVL